MHNTKLAGKIKLAGLNKSQFADKIKVDKSTVTRWISGESQVPGVVYMYLDLFIAYDKLIDTIISNIKSIKQ
jgi:transcriptional regulator with XRE-family HTH domain